MAVVKWDPLRDLLSLQDRMNRLFEQTMSHSRSGQESAHSTWVPAVDIYETPEAIVMQAELPGLAREDIQIELRENTLTVRGERRFAKDVQQENYLRIERAYGAFQRGFPLPTTVRQDSIRAVFRDGVLELTLPKADAARAHRVTIDIQ